MLKLLWSRFSQWETTAQVALLLALLLLLLSSGALLAGPDDLRQPALIGTAGLIIVIQFIFLWANRGMVTPYTRAQRAFLAEDFEHAALILDELRQRGKADYRALTLLGNAYRQMGRLPESSAALAEALAIQPNHHFPLYGFGRTLHVEGRYAEAAAAFEQALAAGAPDIVRLDLGEVYFRQGRAAEAAATLNQTQTDEPHRLLMKAYVLYRLGAGAFPDAGLVEVGLPYWRASAERFSATPYGQQLAEDIDWLESEQEK